MALLMREESAIVLSILSKCEDTEIVEKIAEVIKESTAEVHLELYNEALEFKKNHGRFPDFGFFKKNHPDVDLGAPYTGEYSFDLIAEFLLSLRKEVGARKAQELLIAGKFDEAAKECTDLLSTQQTLTEYTAQDAVDEYDKMCNHPSGVWSGIKAVDDLIKGFTIGTMTVIAAPPACFKTTLAQNIAYYALLKQMRVGFITLELQKRNIYNNILSRHSYELKLGNLPAEHMHKQILAEFTDRGDPITKEMREHGIVQRTEYDVFKDVVADFQKKELDKRFWVVSATDVVSWEPSYMTRLLEQLDEKLGGLDVLFIDYIQILRGFAPNIAQSADFVNNLISHISLQSKTFKGRGFISFLLSQVNRESLKIMEKSEGDKGMSLASFAEFHALEREAHYGILLYADAADKAHGNLKLKVIKNRTGASHEVPQVVTIVPDRGVIGWQTPDEVLDSSRHRNIIEKDLGADNNDDFLSQAAQNFT